LFGSNVRREGMRGEARKQNLSYAISPASKGN